MRPRWSLLMALLAVVVASGALTACGGSGGTTTTTAAGTTPASGGGTTEGGNEGSAAMAGGEPEALFRANCSSCHKLAAAEATFGEYGPDLDKLELDEAAIKTQVENGGGIMPAFGKSEILTPPEIEAVSRYVATEAGR